MGNIKKELKYFSIAQYRKEEEYLSKMHRQGWRLTKVTAPCIYHFEQCEPSEVFYRLDYNQEGIAHKEEYVKMFADCGWEYLFDFVGYSYFRKEAEDLSPNTEKIEQGELDGRESATLESEEKSAQVNRETINVERVKKGVQTARESVTPANMEKAARGSFKAAEEEIFCDDESRLDMMKRVYKGRVIPLIIIFLCVILPQFLLNTAGYNGRSPVQEGLSIALLICGIIYIIVFAAFTAQFYQYEKSVHPEDEKRKVKYFGIYASLLLALLLMGAAVYSSYSSNYVVKDSENRFRIEAERLNSSVIKEYDLKKGEVIEVSHESEGGEFYICIQQKDSVSPVFYGNSYGEFEDFSVEIQEDGCYEITCSGKKAKGVVEISFRR